MLLFVFSTNWRSKDLCNYKCWTMWHDHARSACFLIIRIQYGHSITVNRTGNRYTLDVRQVHVGSRAIITWSHTMVLSNLKSMSAPFHPYTHVSHHRKLTETTIQKSLTSKFPEQLYEQNTIRYMKHETTWSPKCEILSRYILLIIFELEAKQNKNQPYKQVWHK